MRQLWIKELESGQRFDKYLGKYFSEAPKSFLYKMLRKKNITLNGKKAAGNEKIKAGDTVQLFFSEETLEKLCSANMQTAEGELEIVYENDQVLFLNKPCGMLSQKAKKEDVSLVEYLTGYLLESKTLTKEDLHTFHPGICNRLDRNTSGLVAAGKTMQGLQDLSRCFQERSLHKYYLAFVRGKVLKPAHIQGFLRKEERENQVHIFAEPVPKSVPIETKYEPLGISKGGDTLLRVELLTGRSHQIRSHLASIGHPIIGDWKYGEKRKNEYYEKQYGVQSQLLHAWRLKFPAMEGSLAELSGRCITAEMPELFQKVLFGEGLLEAGKREIKEDE